MPTFEADELLKTADRILTAMGASEPNAAVVAEHLVAANLAGHDSHGMIRIAQYHSHAKEGRLVVDGAVEIERPRPTTAVVNGNWTWGQVVATKALELAIEKANRFGLAAVGVRDCYHIGRVGVYAERAAREGFIAKIWCNGHGVARVAPWGGAEAKLATNPIAAAVPTHDEPIVVDITTSVVAEGKVRIAQNAGKQVPAGWLLDRAGEPTTEPADLYAGGTLLPLGGPVGHKGYALGLLVDLLGGVLSGAGCGLMASTIGNGILVELLDPDTLCDRPTFLDRVGAYRTYIKNAQCQAGVAEILLPGEPESRTTAKRRREGILIDESTWAQVRNVAGELGVST